jgi:hypothetical protein
LTLRNAQTYWLVILFLHSDAVTSLDSIKNTIFQAITCFSIFCSYFCEINRMESILESFWRFEYFWGSPTKLILWSSWEIKSQIPPLSLHEYFTLFISIKVTIFLLLVFNLYFLLKIFNILIIIIGIRKRIVSNLLFVNRCFTR